MTNTNVRGSNLDRQRRKMYLLETYRADVDADSFDRLGDARMYGCNLGIGEPACRCYRCGCLLTYETLTVDRIIPGCKGGTYRRNNIRPSCSDCATKTGNALKAELMRK